MKNITYILILAFLTTISNAQSPILPRYDNPNFREVTNAYYKDINNIHNQYVGTWLYTNGNTSLKIILRKRTMMHSAGNIYSYYADYLVGEYQYIENGIELVNTLASINNEYNDGWDYNLCSTYLKRNDTYPKCNECSPTEKRLNMQFNEPSRRHITGFSNDFALRRFFESETEKLKIWFTCTDNGIYRTKDDFNLTTITGFSLPYGEYTLIKQ